MRETHPQALTSPVPLTPQSTALGKRSHEAVSPTRGKTRRKDDNDLFQIVIDDRWKYASIVPENNPGPTVHCSERDNFNSDARSLFGLVSTDAQKPATSTCMPRTSLYPLYSPYERKMPFGRAIPCHFANSSSSGGRSWL